MPASDGPLGQLLLSRSDLDRSAAERSVQLVPTLLSDPATKVLDLRAGLAQVGDAGLVLRAPAESDRQPVASETDDPEPSQPPSGQPLWIFLGRDAQGVPFLARVVGDAPPESPQPPGSTADPLGNITIAWLGLREAAERLGDRDAGIFTTAVALANWHAAHQFCPRCGQPSAPAAAGWIRVCTVDGSEHYPRTDPAIIVAVVDADDRLLLGHNRAWPDGRFSTLAGFVEPGESLGDAVRREVFEESGVQVGDVTFLGSQPWPFPVSLMLGCTALATCTDIAVDGDEVTQARWFTREELASEVATGRVIPPGGVSIARRLVEHWFGGPIPDGPQRW